MIEIFINELSLEGQYVTGKEFVSAIKGFIAIFSLIHSKVGEKQMYRDSRLINREAVGNKNFLASFNNIRNRQLKDAFRNVIFNKMNPKDWRTDQRHSLKDTFLYVTSDGFENVTDTTLAEASERTLQNALSVRLLVNFTGSKFQGNQSLRVLKNEDEKNVAELDCIENKKQIEKWLGNKLKLSRWNYDDTSDKSPSDEQTVLRDNIRFRKTSKRYDDRSIYLEILKNRYWYVDNFHTGKSSHLEVFDGTGKKHIGKATLNGEMIPNSSDPTKHELKL